MQEEGKAKAFSRINNRNTNEFNTFLPSDSEAETRSKPSDSGYGHFFTFNTRLSQESVFILSPNQKQIKE